MDYSDSAAWTDFLETQAVLPEGFEIAVASLGFTPAEKPDAGVLPMRLSLIRTVEPTRSFAGVFTKNAFPGWPVVMGRELMSAPAIQGVLVNNKVANVGAAGGLEASRRLADSVRKAMGDDAPYVPSSTGVIGWALPVDEMEAALPELASSRLGDSVLPFAEAIMTTDAWPKVRSAPCGEGRIVGCAKGAGMVEPNMATMLSFLLTDSAVPRDAARRILPKAVERSFNRISVDGETSTSDTVILLSSGRRPYPGDEAFTEALFETSSALAEDVVRNGEGCAHVFRVTVSGAPDERTAVALARSVANAPLTKTAVRGNDPNIGRILQAVGAACGRLGVEFPRDRAVLSIGGVEAYSAGEFRLDGAVEEEVSGYLRERELPLPAPGWPVHEDRVEIDVRLDSGGASASVIGSDLSEEYVKINADYRT